MSRYQPAKTLALTIAALAFGLLSACSTFASRSHEKAALFATLDATTQARLKAGNIQIGDTPEMVYIAIGKPDEKKEKITAAGIAGIWIYRVCWEEYQGTRWVGFHRDVAYNPSTKNYRIFYRPDYQPVYTHRVEDRLRVFFESGRVTAVEKAQPVAQTTHRTIC